MTQHVKIKRTLFAIRIITLITQRPIPSRCTVACKHVHQVCTICHVLAGITLAFIDVWNRSMIYNYPSWLNTCINLYPMLRADSRFWLVINREIWSRISSLMSSAWDIKTKERHWWRHTGDSDRRPLSLPLRYDLVTLCLYGDLGQINVIAGILKLRKRFRMSQILFEHGINSLPLLCFRGYGNLSTLSIAIPCLAFGRAWCCNATCG